MCNLEIRLAVLGLTFTFLSFFGCVTSSESITTDLYGQSCSHTSQCSWTLTNSTRRRTGLTCQKSICLCSNHEDMTYDETSQNCKVRVNRPCQEHAEYAIICVNNAYCDKTQQICKCRTNFMKTAEGTCVELGEFNSTCSNSNECDQKKLGLECINGTCQCDLDTSVENWTILGQSTFRARRQCVGLVGQECKNGHCVEDAICKPDNKCTCQVGRHPDKNGFCTIRGYSKECNYEQGVFCHSNFSCIEFKCTCKYNGKHQFYDTGLKKCRSLVWGPCEMNGFAEQCIEHSECVKKSGNLTSHCKCKDGFIGTPDGKCELRYGSKCGVIKNSDSGNLVNCDQTAKLVCKNGKCGCADDLQVYDEKLRKCIGLAGAFCDNENGCTENSICVDVEGGTLRGRGQCTCLPFRELLANGTCAFGDVMIPQIQRLKPKS